MKTFPLFAIGLLFAVGPIATAQTTAAQGAHATPGVSGKFLEFEVATVKPVDPKNAHGGQLWVYPGGRVVIPGTDLKGLIVTAFGLSYWQISGGDPWVQKDTYDVEGKPPKNLQSSIDLRYTWWRIEDEHLREMLQALLIDRFKLKFHRETKTGTVYLLERSGKTLRLSPTRSADLVVNAMAPAGHSGDIGFAGRWVVYNTSMAQLAKFASDVALHAPVLDRTELSGQFDYKEPEPPADSDANRTDFTDNFMRLIPELGLKFERTKGPVETFVIDHAEKPTPN